MFCDGFVIIPVFNVILLPFLFPFFYCEIMPSCAASDFSVYSSVPLCVFPSQCFSVPSLTCPVPHPIIRVCVYKVFILLHVLCQFVLSCPVLLPCVFPPVSSPVFLSVSLSVPSWYVDGFCSLFFIDSYFVLLHLFTLFVAYFVFYPCDSFLVILDFLFYLLSHRLNLIKLAFFFTLNPASRVLSVPTNTSHQPAPVGLCQRSGRQAPVCLWNLLCPLLNSIQEL